MRLTYAATVPNATTHVTIAWTTTETTATVADNYGAFSNPFLWTLNAGDRLVSSYDVTVTAPDGTTTKDFDFRVTREAATVTPPPGTRPTVSIAAVTRISHRRHG